MRRRTEQDQKPQSSGIRDTWAWEWRFISYGGACLPSISASTQHSMVFGYLGVFHLPSFPFGPRFRRSVSFISATGAIQEYHWGLCGFDELFRELHDRNVPCIFGGRSAQMGEKTPMRSSIFFIFRFLKPPDAQVDTRHAESTHQWHFIFFLSGQVLQR